MASGYTDDKGKLNPLLQPGDGRNYQAWPVPSSEAAGPPEVMWLEPEAIVDVSNDLAKNGLPVTAGNVRQSLVKLRDKYPHYYKPKEGAFIRDNQLQFGPAKANPPQAGVGTGWEWLDNRTAGAGNAFMGGIHTVIGAGEGIDLKGSMQDQAALQQAIKTNGQEQVTDAVNEAAKAGLPLPTEDPAAVLAELIAQGGRDTTARTVGTGFGFYNPNYAQEFAADVKNDPRYQAAADAKRDADNLVARHNDAQDRIKEQQKRREMAYGIFMNPPSSTEHGISYGHGMGVPPKFQTDSRIAGDYPMSQVAEWAKSLTPEQRAGMTREQVQAKIDEILSGVITGDVNRKSSIFADRDAKVRYWSPQSKATELYNKEGNNYGDVYDEYGLSGVFNVGFSQLASSAPNTGATMAATALTSLASGPAAVYTGPAAMGLSTAALSAGTGFNQAFGTWIAQRGIDLNDLRNPNDPGLTPEEKSDRQARFNAAQAKINAMAAEDPSGFMGQMDEMLATSTKKGIAEGATAVVLNKVGDVLTDKIKGALPKSMQAPGTSGSLLRPLPAIVARPVQTFRDGIYKKILWPRAVNGLVDTWWEATEEGLTDIITNTIMGEDVDLKTALSSFLVGGMMGGASAFGAGKSNIDNPLQIIQEKAAEGESGLDQVAAEIEKNTGMPAARAKASIQKAGEILQQFETFAKRYPPSMRGHAWRYFIKGYKGNKSDLFSHEQDIRRATIKDKQAALAALEEALNQEKLMAIRPENVPVSPIIPSLRGDIDRLRQGFDYTKGEGRYYHPLDRTHGE